MGNNSDNERVLRKVKELTEKAKDLKLPGMLWEIFNEVKYYASWIENKRGYVSTCIIDFKEIHENKFQFKFKEGLIAFSMESKRGQYDTAFWSYETVKLYFNDKKVFEFKMSDVNAGNFSDWSMPKWELSEIIGFFDGEWVALIKSLYQILKSEQDEIKQMDDKKKKEEEIRNLKTNFGID